MPKKSPLYFTGLTPDGRLLLGGVFRMKDEVGFPLDMSYEIAKEKGWLIDWMEYLADAGRQKQPKIESCLREIGYLLGEDEAKKIGDRFVLWVKYLVGTGDIKLACDHIMERKHESPVKDH
jgi:hypothetical protein